MTFRLPQIFHATPAKRSRASGLAPPKVTLGTPASLIPGSTTQPWAPTLMLLAITEVLLLEASDPLYIRYTGCASPERLVLRRRPSAYYAQYLAGDPIPEGWPEVVVGTILEGLNKRGLQRRA